LPEVPLIHALDCITLRAASRSDVLRSYAALLGRSAAASDATALQLANVRLEFVEKPASADGGLAGLTFSVADLSKAQNLLERRAMRMHLVSSPGQAARRLHLATDSTFGVPISLVQREPGVVEEPTTSTADTAAAVSGLDHAVIRTPHPERAVALYAGRLGLSLRLDRTEPSWGARLLFFRCGDLILEVVHDLEAGTSDAPDRLWGLSWRVPDVAAAHARLAASGIAVSEVRTGRRPGTQVFTVRNHTAGVPTIMVGPAADAA
jgi:catechol 2,3-dioxygenase-like lactoylglutathione lyase family enzyme